ncbi:hypothetical protein LOD99_12198 [Oopsacas minuta]|uniref:Syntaxin 6/10/61 N-terminal domain-containing protein n=1 Tax=Oopsacas minuta TaxID=111878 RepID=A0AAV7JFM6_9METZ|nr:hypothetical protein LOD99_12198 [Oopsacas minuta]
MSQNDPFIMVRDAVSKSLVETEDIFQRWTDIHSKPYLGSVQELGQVTKQLRERLKGIEWDLEDLDETVKVVESNPERYRVDPGELNRRKVFISKSASRVKVTQLFISLFV